MKRSVDCCCLEAAQETTQKEVAEEKTQTEVAEETIQTEAEEETTQTDAAEGTTQTEAAEGTTQTEATDPSCLLEGEIADDDCTEAVASAFESIPDAGILPQDEHSGSKKSHR